MSITSGRRASARRRISREVSGVDARGETSLPVARASSGDGFGTGRERGAAWRVMKPTVGSGAGVRPVMMEVML